MKLITALVILCSTFLVATVLAQSTDPPQCGRQAGGKVCQNGLCCSRVGFCGSTEPWCGAGCQSNCWADERPDHRCGPSYGNAACGKDRCCSIWSWCGTGRAYCGNGVCQYQCLPTIGANRALAMPHNMTFLGVL